MVYYIYQVKIFKKIKSNKEKEMSLIDKKNKNKENIKCLGKYV